MIIKFKLFEDLNNNVKNGDIVICNRNLFEDEDLLNPPIFGRKYKILDISKYNDKEYIIITNIETDELYYNNSKWNINCFTTELDWNTKKYNL